MDKKQKKHVENKPVFKASNAIKCNGNTNVSERQKNSCKRLKKARKQSFPSFVDNSLILHYNALFTLLKSYSLNNRIDVYILLCLFCSSDPLSLSSITRLSAISLDKYTLAGVNRLVSFGLVERVLTPKPVYCLSLSCKEELIGYM